MVKRAYRYRFYPTPGQADELNRTFGCVRKVYNLALDARTVGWYQEQRRVTYVDTSAMLTEWKRQDDLAFLNDVSSVPLQQTLRHLQAAFTGFFDKRSRYPRFKSRKRSRASAAYTRSGFRWRGGQLTLAKMNEPLNIRWSRPLPEGADPSTVTVSRDPAGRWHVSLLVESVIEPLPAANTVVGIDAGITSLLTLSTGEKITNPRHERKDRERLAKAQRRLARKQKGSKNRAKAREKVGRIHVRMTSWVADGALPGGVVLTSSRWTMVAFASAALTATLPAPRCSSRMVAGCSGRASRTAPDAGRVVSSGARRTGGALSVRDAIRIRPASHRTDRAAKAFAGPFLARSAPTRARAQRCRCHPTTSAITS